MGKKTYHYINGEQIFYEEELESVYIQPKTKKGSPKNKILTLDTETRRLENGDLEVISIAVYDGQDYKTWYIADYVGSDPMIQDCIRWLLNSKKYNHHVIYVHNLSGFDGIFLLKNLAQYKDKVSLV